MLVDELGMGVDVGSEAYVGCMRREPRRVLVDELGMGVDVGSESVHVGCFDASVVACSSMNWAWEVTSDRRPSTSVVSEAAPVCSASMSTAYDASVVVWLYGFCVGGDGGSEFGVVKRRGRSVAECSSMDVVFVVTSSGDDRWILSSCQWNRCWIRRLFGVSRFPSGWRSSTV